MEDRRWTGSINNPYASSGKCLLQYGKGENHVLGLGEAESTIREEFELLETHPDPIIVQHADEWDRTTHVNNFNWVLTKLASYNLNFVDAVKALALL